MNVSGRLAAQIGGVAAGIAVAFVAGREGYRPTVYSDPIGRSAVCWGHDDPKLKLGTTYTREQCEAMLSEDLSKHAEALECVHVPLSNGQKAALVSFAYNVGGSKLCSSTMVQKANAGAQPVEWCAELKKWVFAGGQKLPGLVNRRQAEYGLCIT